MASMGDDDDQNQECKCYKVTSVKPIRDKHQVFDMLATFLKSDRQRQQSAVADEDQVREKASWNELRRWANSLLTDNDAVDDRGNPKKQKPIEDWLDDRAHLDENDYEEEIEDEQAQISESLVKKENAEATGRSEVAIAGRGADDSFVDNVSDNAAEEDSSGAEPQEAETKEAKRARKKAKKEAKKAKKERKEAKKAKKEKKATKKSKTEV